MDYLDSVPYVSFKEIDFTATAVGLRSLLLGDGPDLSFQGLNIGIVDKFITQLEYDLLKTQFEEERTPIDKVVFVSAQSQMWIFAVYELLRTWRGQAKKMLSWGEMGVLEKMRDGVDEGILNLSSVVRKAQIQMFIDNSSLLKALARDYARTDTVFYLVEAIRIRLAKHELPKGGGNSRFPRAPTHGTINRWCGALDYELDDGVQTTIGMVNRRDIAEGIRQLALNEDPQDEQTRNAMKEWLRGPRWTE
ncbi:hypothetical protein ACEN9F_10960 [Duganella sp. CT11-25]|uniref:hypothetical protein n=1 Tax=unclassified Duganella TaxID=2636909 RepID=UPI0039B0BF60